MMHTRFSQTPIWELNQECHINPHGSVWQIEAWTQQIASENPDLISRSAIGTTFEGRTMHLLKVIVLNHDLAISEGFKSMNSNT